MLQHSESIWDPKSGGGCVQNTWLLYRVLYSCCCRQGNCLEFKWCITNTYFMRSCEEPKRSGWAGRPAPINAHVPQNARFDGMDHLVTETERQARWTGKAKTKCIKCNVGLHGKSCIMFHQHFTPKYIQLFLNDFVKYKGTCQNTELKKINTIRALISSFCIFMNLWPFVPSVLYIGRSEKAILKM